MNTILIVLIIIVIYLIHTTSQSKEDFWPKVDCNQATLESCKTFPTNLSCVHRCAKLNMDKMQKDIAENLNKQQENLNKQQENLNKKQENKNMLDCNQATLESCKKNPITRFSCVDVCNDILNNCSQSTIESCLVSPNKCIKKCIPLLHEKFSRDKQLR
jgi:hypothetical protein